MSENGLEIRLLDASEEELIAQAAEGVFDHAPDARWTAEFLQDPRHHIAVALLQGRVVGFTSGVHYVHPDKRPELWINEVGVAEGYRGRGIGKALLDEMFACGRALGCKEAWVLTERDNVAARALYSSVGGNEGDEDTVMYSFALEP